MNICSLKFLIMELICTFATGELAEWSNAAVLKTVEGHTSGGSNPSLSAVRDFITKSLFFF